MEIQALPTKYCEIHLSSRLAANNIALCVHFHVDQVMLPVCPFSRRSSDVASKAPAFEFAWAEG